MDKLTDVQIADRLKQLPGWQRNGPKISRQFEFGNFSEAFAWMTRIAIEAEKANHHPEWSNVYNRVRVELTTHDAAGLTELDFALAEKMNELFG